MKIKTYEDGSARLLWSYRDIALTTADFEALREYFQAERDEALGRIRDKVNPRFVWYPRPDSGLRILDEVDGRVRHVWKELVSGGVASEYRDSAQRYFEDLLREPWEDANVGDLWVFTIRGVEQVFRSTEDGWCHLDTGWRPIALGAWVTAGRRIWPEGEDK